MQIQIQIQIPIIECTDPYLKNNLFSFFSKQIPLKVTTVPKLKVFIFGKMLFEIIGYRLKGIVVTILVKLQ